ncbi:MAG: ABC transporter permease subunit [Eubacterium sp.]|nr:ABC transporter permease subunit [Eubacterium sp.]
MHNLGSLYKTELKKILSKRAVWITLVIGMALLIIAEISNIHPFGIGGRYDFPDGTSMSAYEFYQQQKKTSEEITGQKLDDVLLQKMRTEMKEFLKDKQDLPYAETTGSKEYRGIWFAAEKLGYEDLLSKLYTQFQDAEDPNRLLMESDAAEYYQAVADNLNHVFSRDGLSEEETAYWSEKYDRQSIPFAYGYAHGYSGFIQMFYVYIWFVFLLIAVSLAGVFSEEVSHRTDAMILSTRNGRKPVSLVKLCAGITVGTLEMAIVLGVNLAVCLITFGHGGWDAPLLMVIQSTAWDLMVGQGILIFIGLALVLAMVFAAVTMLLSQTLGSSTGVLAVQIGIFLLGIFNIPDSLGIISQLWSIRPTNFLMYYAFSKYRLFNIGSHFLNVFQAAGILYPLLIAAAVPITYVSYQRMQVKSR